MSVLAFVWPVALAMSWHGETSSSALDFWVGTWNVYVADQLVGRDVVEKSMDGNVVSERWEDVDGNVGISFFYFMPAKKQWKQIWATPAGVYKEKYSEPIPGGIRFSGHVFLPNGKEIPDRTTLTLGEGGTVRQVIEQARDGKVWRTGFDAIYKRDVAKESPSSNAAALTDADQISAINKQYVAAWLAADKEGVLQLFEPGAVLTPSGMKPLKGIAEFTEFWFPNDGSKTTINKFTSTILSVDVDGDFANSTQKVRLSWNYEKGSTKLARDQWGYELTTYRRQQSGGWKIWRQVWTDYKVVDK